MISNIGRLFKYVADPKSAATFRAFLVEEGLVNSPELAGLDAAIAAQERNLRSKSLSFLLPSLAVSGEVNRTFSEEGAGSEGGLDLGVPLDLPEADDTDWSVALTLGFPLFRGGSKFAARRKALEELSGLRVQRQAVAEMMELRIRISVHLASASYAGIRQARLAADGADKSLDVVSDAYSRGAVSILDLLDAQNAALVANLAAANATYDFLIDLMALERAAGRFEFFASEEEREEVLDRVERYFEAARTSDN
jgi:outer membrane protein TolC